MFSKIIHTNRMKRVRVDRDWRPHMTPEERKEHAALEREIAKIEKKVLALRNERKKIQNRATQRVGK